MSRGDGMPPQEQVCCCVHCQIHAPKPSPAVEEGPAGGEAGRRLWFCGSGDCIGSDAHRAEKRREGFDAGHQRGLEVGEKGMRERAATLDDVAAERYAALADKAARETNYDSVQAREGIVQFYLDRRDQHRMNAKRIRALPLSVADGPAPAKELVITQAEAASVASSHNDGPMTWLAPAPSPPTAEEGAEKDEMASDAFRAAYERSVKRATGGVLITAEERAALLACREALRTVLGEIGGSFIVDYARKALAAADAVVKP